MTLVVTFASTGAPFDGNDGLRGAGAAVDNANAPRDKSQRASNR